MRENKKRGNIKVENLNTSVKLERDGKEYKLLNKCVNDYLINQNKSIEIGTINKIEKIPYLKGIF